MGEEINEFDLGFREDLSYGQMIRNQIWMCQISVNEPMKFAYNVTMLSNMIYPWFDKKYKEEVVKAETKVTPRKKMSRYESPHATYGMDPRGLNVFLVTDYHHVFRCCIMLCHRLKLLLNKDEGEMFG